MSGPWLMPFHPGAPRPVTLLCLAPAGAGCGQYRSWQAMAGEEVSVVGVQLPGRETRFAHPPAEGVSQAVTAVLEELKATLPPDGTLIVFGQSFGGLLGYEITRRLGEEYDRWPRALVVAGCRPPHMWVGAGRGLADHDAELAKLLDVRALDDDDLDEDSRELMLDVLRQDARLSLTYDHHAAAIPSTLEAWGGETDATVTSAHLDGWRAYAAGAFRRRMFPGGHYFCLDRAGEVVAGLRQYWSRP
ncbi:thioesterase II family protein [Nonomuraea endophytica]|uniref:Surfactin synthase thioesterase subunit n=1 Tax=Nonomuraea endophytica TaxID=714136 RepID=A0A7W8ACB8_9ACTN|nr:thioesterase [Nonomuraea endophytica]MBB5083639.1 surfactin synthase thioesterase subunit [Nonomuraea endophytica]